MQGEDYGSKLINVMVIKSVTCIDRVYIQTLPVLASCAHAVYMPQNIIIVESKTTSHVPYGYYMCLYPLA